MTPGVAHTIVNPGFFADDYLVPIGLAAHLGMFPWMYGDSRNAPPSNEDIARVAATVLMDPARHAGKSYRPTGPKLLGAKEMAQAIGRAVGRSVRVMPTPSWLFMKSARIAGLPMDAMSNIRYYIEDHKRGAFEIGAPTTDVFDVTGRPAEDFESIARRYAARTRNLQPGTIIGSGTISNVEYRTVGSACIAERRGIASARLDTASNISRSSSARDGTEKPCE